VLWDVFISYASEDSEEVAYPLAMALQKRGLKVWFDEFALKAGDSIRRSIDQGLSASRFAVVILSPHFFRKEWPSRELDGLVAREITSGKIILPVWHDLNAHEIAHFSPPLADRVGVSTQAGIAHVADEIQRAIGNAHPDGAEAPIETSGHSNLQLIDASVDEDGCFYEMRRGYDLTWVEPTSEYHPFASNSRKDIFPIIDIKLRNVGFDPSFLYRISVAIVRASPLEWGKKYYHPPGPVHVSAKYHLLLNPELVGRELTQSISLKVEPHDVERFQLRLASENAAKYEVRFLLHFDIGGVLDLGVFLLTIPGAFHHPEKIIGPTVDDKVAVLRYASDRFAKAVAAHELKRTGSKRASGALVDALSDSNASVRSAAAEALGRCGNKETVPILIGLLRADPDDVLRASAASALGHLGDSSAVLVLISALSDTSPRVRRTAAESLGNLRDAAAVQPLVRLLAEETEWPIRDSVATALASIGDKAAFESLVASARRHKGNQGEIRAIRTLKHPDSLDFFLELLSSDDHWCRREATDALGDLGNRVAEPALKSCLRPEEDSDVRRGAAVSLALLGDMTHLKEVLGSNPWWERYLVEELPSRGNLRAIAVLHEIASFHSDDGVLVAVAKELSAFDDPYGREILRRQLDKSSDAIEAAESLARLGDLSGSQYLEDVVAASPSPDVQLAAACALGRLGHPSAFRILVNHLKSASVQRLQEVAISLAQLGDVKALPALMEAWYGVQDKGIGTWAWSVCDPKRAIESAIESLVEKSFLTL
jgi:HEAT repeat protein